MPYDGWMTRSLLGVIVVISLLACGTPPAPETGDEDTSAGCPPDRTCDFEMELGVGLDAFESVVPMDDVDVILGPQGGYHVWLAARCRDCSPQVVLTYGIRGSADDAWLYGQPLKGISNLQDADGWRQTTGLFGLLPGAAAEVDYRGQVIVLDVTIDDAERTASRRTPVRIAHVETWDCPTSDPDNCFPPQ